MPFTVSHTAAVLPVHRWLTRARVLPAAVIGSMVPDFGMFLPFWVPRYETHGRLALLTFCLPLGLATWLLYEILVRPALLEVVPDRWWARCCERGAMRFGSWRTWLLAAAAVLGGALTHLVWDGFTHEDARGVAMFPALVDLSVHINGHPMYLYRALQHLSSILGLAALSWFAWRWQRRLPVAASAPARALLPAERWSWIAVYVAIPAAASAVAAALTLAGPEPFYATSASLGGVAEAGMAAATASLLVVSPLLRLRLGLQRG
jgi:hypothetical protein